MNPRTCIPTCHEGQLRRVVAAFSAAILTFALLIPADAAAGPRGRVRAEKFDGTSMAAAVASGVVAAMLDANDGLTPNAVKAMLQYSAVILPDADELMQGVGSLDADGAVALAAAVDPGAEADAWWLTSPVSETSTIADESVAWGQRLIWGDRLVWGDRIVWGNGWAAN